MSSKWLFQSATELGLGIAKGQIDPVELTEAYLAAIDAHPLRDRIYSAVTHERARAEAKAAAGRAASHTRAGPLDGVPISWKDLFDSAGTRTEAGSAYLKGRIPKTDAEVLDNAKNAGLVCLGKTHMSELAFSGLGYNPVTATPPCVNDAAAAPGGSSSGAATSVAFGLAACAVGSDTGGSVRIPSGWNDLVGLKTTHGLLSLNGVVPLCETFDTVGPLCRTVADAANMLSALSGSAAVDISGADLSGRRFAIPVPIALADVRAEPMAGFERATNAITAAGGIIERVDIPEISHALDLSACLFTVDAYAQWQDVIEADPSLMFHEILDRFRAGARFSGLEFVQGWMKLRKLRAGYLRATAGYDAVIVPTSPILPPNVQRLATDSDYYIAENILALRNTRIGNLMGLTALNLPTGVASTGILLMTSPFSEGRLLRLGAAVEAAINQ